MAGIHAELLSNMAAIALSVELSIIENNCLVTVNKYPVL